MKMYAVYATHDNKAVQICKPFGKESLAQIKELIQVPVVTRYGVFQPSELWIEKTKQKKSGENQ